MTGFERIKAAVHFQKPDRTPVVGQVFGHAAVLSGVPLKQYLQSGELLARCQLRALAYYGYDAVFALLDVNVETEAIGSELTFRENQYPFIHNFILPKDGTANMLSIPEPQKDGRMPELLKAAAIMREELEDTVLVAGCVAGPMTLTAQLMGMENALYTAADNPDRFAALLDFSTDAVIRFGCAQLAAGVHLPVVFNPAASPAVIPPNFFREFELPRLKKIFAAFTEAGALANWLHITGPTLPILEYYPEIGADIANIDYPVEIDMAAELLPKTCVNGNIKPLQFVEASAGDIAEEASEVVNYMAEKRSGFILSPGCEIPPEGKPENILAMVNSVRYKR